MLSFLLFHPAYGQASSTTILHDTQLESRMNFRMGFSSATTNGRPTLCLEGMLHADLSLETCGTGYGFVHRELGTDFVHFRGKWSFLSRQLPHTTIHAQLGAGFAEIQVAADEAGFQFAGTGTGVETAGPEASISVQWLHRFGPQTEIIMDMNIGTAFFAFGPDLILPQPQVFPFAELSVGVGW